MSESAIKIRCSTCGESNDFGTKRCYACEQDLPQEIDCGFCGMKTPKHTTCKVCGTLCCEKCHHNHGCVFDQDHQNFLDIHPTKGGYKIWRIPKRDGSYRLIEEPNPELKKKQRGLLKILLRLFPTLGPYAHGFMKFRSIVTNAKRHFTKDPDSGALIPPKNLLKVDLRDFFPSVNSKMVWRAGQEWNVPPYIAEEVQEICFRDDRLPQGAPTSPFLANLAATRLDFRLAGLAKKWRSKTRYQAVRYSRYADDLAFSSDYPRLIDLLHPIRRIVADCGFQVHDRKIEFHRQPAQLRICGIVVNHKLSVPRSYWRRLRATLHGARTDIESGMVPKGHCFPLDGKARKRLRDAAGINGRSGIVGIHDLPPEAVSILGDTEFDRIPWENLRGQISFVSSVDQAMGARLGQNLEALRRACD